MTKAVRIENADTNPSKRLVVEIWENRNDLQLVLMHTFNLEHPTDITTQYLHKSNFIKIYEVDSTKE
jgi:hypothetical protein